MRIITCWMCMRYAEDHKQATKAKVLRAAARAIRQDGPDRVGVAAIMAKVGLTHGGFYAHFASKDDLLTQAIGQMFEESSVKFAGAIEGRPLDAALTLYFDAYLSPRHRDRRDSGCPLPALSADLARLPEPSREAFGRGVADMTDGLAKALAAVGRKDADRLACATLAEMVGAVALARAVPDAAQSDAILSAAREAIRERCGV